VHGQLVLLALYPSDVSAALDFFKEIYCQLSYLFCFKKVFFIMLIAKQSAIVLKEKFKARI
jgi:hypothetical protein